MKRKRKNVADYTVMITDSLAGLVDDFTNKITVTKLREGKNQGVSSEHAHELAMDRNSTGTRYKKSSWHTAKQSLTGTGRLADFVLETR